MTDAPDPLVAGLRAGEADAAARLEELWRSRLTRFCRGYVDTELAEDVVQDVFVAVLETERVPERFAPWIYTLARNRCLNERRNRGRNAAEPLASHVELARTLSGERTRAARREELDRLARAIAGLPPEQGEALRLRYLEGMSRDEIAEVVGVPVSTVKSRLFEGTRRLRRTCAISRPAAS